jgi:hypothetical protein
MAAIDSDLIRVIIEKLKVNSGIMSGIASDGSGNKMVRPATYSVIDMLMPAITVNVSDGGSEPIIPASSDTLSIIVWCGDKVNKEFYKFLKGKADLIITLFNREGDDFNNIDIPTDTGVRFCQLLKQNVSFGFDDEFKKYYVEVIFWVIRSEDESFKASDAGDAAWDGEAQLLLEDLGKLLLESGS